MGFTEDRRLIIHMKTHENKKKKKQKNDKMPDFDKPRFDQVM